MDLVLVALPVLALLACPLMMVVCFLAMRRMGHDEPNAVADVTPATREQQIADLQRQLQAIQFELTKFQAKRPPVVTSESQTVELVADEVAVGVGYAE